MKTITKDEYFKNVIAEKAPLFKKEWFYKAFTLPILRDEDLKGKDPNDLVIRADGLYTLDDMKELVRISDWTKGEPLFDHQEIITFEKGLLPNIRKDIEAKRGVGILNAVTFHGIEDRTEFVNGDNLDPKKFTSTITEKVVDDADFDGKNGISVTEMLSMADRMRYFDSFGEALVTTATERTITRAKGIDEYRAKLLKEYEGQLQDPIKLVELQNKLREYDAEYLKGDLAAKNVFVAKTRVGREKMYNMYGKGLDFVNDPNNDTLILSSVSDGMSYERDEVPKYFNDLRAASFNRGSKTALGGYTYELIQKSLAGMRISSEPCKTTEGLVKEMTEAEIQYSVGRYIKDKGKWKRINSTEEARALPKIVEMRSPMYCIAEGDDYCYACISAYYKNLPNAVSNLASAVSDVLLNMFLKLMHGVKTGSVEIRPTDLFN